MCFQRPHKVTFRNYYLLNSELDSLMKGFPDDLRLVGFASLLQLRICVTPVSSYTPVRQHIATACMQRQIFEASDSAMKRLIKMQSNAPLLTLYFDMENSSFSLKMCNSLLIFGNEF